MINPGSRQSICRREITAIRKRLQKQYNEQLKVISTPEEGEALRTRLQQEFDEAVRPYADDITIDERCRVCGYILYGLPQPRCPECGTGFDPKLLEDLTEPGVTEGPSRYTLY